jgi:Ribosomal protein S3, C-terminal domain
MGQKVNPNIFRLGVNKKWKTEFFEKKSHELPLYTFKNLEMKSYIERFLKIQGIILHDYKQHYSNSTLNLYISYFVLPEFVNNNKHKATKITLVNNEGESKVAQNQFITATHRMLSGSHSHLFNTQTSINYYNIKKYLNTNQVDHKLTFTNLTNGKALTNPISLTELKIEGVLNNLFKVLSLFTNNRFNIVANFCCLNKNLNFLKRTQKKNFILLQKFKGTPFLKEGVELLFHAVYTSDSATLLAKFIAIQVKKIKRHKFFLAFLKQTLTVLINSNFSKVKGIKIIIKGRLNGVPRASHKIVNIGDVPVQSISATIDYAQTTTHNANGSYGIKVWIVEKD